MRKVRKDGKDKISIQRLLLLIAATVALLILLLTLFLTMCTKTALTFEVDGEVYVTVNATGEETLTLPEEPEKDGYVFDGWYWDKDIWEQPFTGDTPLTGDGKLYAKWKPAHEHSFGEWEAVTPATCITEGQRKRVCACGAEETEVIPKVAHTYETKHDATNHWQECSVCQDKVNITAHNFGDWTVVTPATCTAAGQKKHVCACGAEETEAIQKLDHSYEVKHNATNHWSECRVCHEKINVTAHSFGVWEVVTPATCTAEGQKKRVCTVCPEEQMAAITKLEHTYETKYNATNHWEECSVCQETINVTAHTFGDWTVITPATCTAAGEQKHVCSCGAEETAAIQKLDHTYEVKHDATNHWEECTVCQDKINLTTHTYGDWTVVTPATCTAAGEKKHACACGAEQTAAITKLEHTYVTKHNQTNHWQECSVCQDKSNVTAHSFGAWEVVTAASCTAEGLQKHVCACGAEETEAIQKLAHTYGDWTVTPATCTAEGQKNHTCSVCGTEQTEAIQKLPHTYETKFDATNHWQECSVCGETSNQEAHTYENGLCTVCGRVYGTEGLMYRKITNGYAVSGIGTAVNNVEIAIPSWHEGESVTAIDSYAFRGRGSLTKIEIPNSITKIGVRSFLGCSNLRSVEITPNSGLFVDREAFRLCENLTKVEVNDLAAWCQSSFRTDNSNPLSIAKHLYINGVEVTELVIPDGVTKIGNRVFENWSNLQSVVIPQSVTSIAGRVFADCIGLTSLVIPSNLTIMGQFAFGGCSGLIDVEFQSGVTDIGNLAFSGCVGLTNIVIPSSVITIEENAFADCVGLTSVEIQNGVTSIEPGAFRGCGNLTAIEIPKSVTSIGKKDGSIFRGGVFSLCDNLETIAVAEGNTVYRSAGNCIIETATNTLIEGCKTSEIPTDGSVTSIGTFAFSERGSLQNIVIPIGVTSIGEWAFQECKSLQSIDIPNGVTSIGKSAFLGCGSLKSISLPQSVTSIDGSMFSRCGSLETITVAEGNPNYFSVDNCLIETSTQTLMKGSRLSVIPTDGSVTIIGSSAFNESSGLISIAIPNGVTKIGNSAFTGCGGLTTIVIPNSVTEFGEYLFTECGNLQNIEYQGTIAEWNAITKRYRWKDETTGEYTVTCTDGTLTKAES